MKKVMIAVCVIVALVILADAAYFRLGWYIDLNPSAPVTAFVKTDGKRIMMDRGDGFEPFEIKGVDLGSGKPGEWASAYAVDGDTYLRWFREIKEMGANTIRVYSVGQDVFYRALYEFNENNPDPLWLLQGVWIDDEVQRSVRDAYDPAFCEDFLKECRVMLDVIHGARKLSPGRRTGGSGAYRRDVSRWVIGYILGVEWDGATVAFTDEKYAQDSGHNRYCGEYLCTGAQATPFESMLARVGDGVISYESARYKTQKPLAFSNSPATDPFDYPQETASFFAKQGKVDVGHILTTDACIAGQFASYHVYPYYPDYLSRIDDWSRFGIADRAAFTLDGRENTYRAYLTMLNAHHTIPVVISEFGVPSGRGMAQCEAGLGRNQGNMSEREQGDALLKCCEDIKAAGCAGCCVFSWQDEWFRSSWNTKFAVDPDRTPYWSDYQTAAQSFGLLAFDPGETTSVCYPDGDVSEWGEKDAVCENGGMTLSMKYDEKYIYFRVFRKGLDLRRGKIYIPIDLTPESGSSCCQNDGLLFDRAADFLIVLDGKDNSRVLVQERSEALRVADPVNGGVPDKDSPRFVNINMLLQNGTRTQAAETFETGKLTYGNANPESPAFDSKADFFAGSDNVELRLPWQLLNFSDPSRMRIRGDCDGADGVSTVAVEQLWAGVSDGSDKKRIALGAFPLRGWGDRPTFHERLKSAYYALQGIWRLNPTSTEVNG